LDLFFQTDSLLVTLFELLFEKRDVIQLITLLEFFTLELKEVL